MIEYNLEELLTHLHPNKPELFANIQRIVETFNSNVDNKLSIRNGPWLAGGCLRQAIEGKVCETDYDFLFTGLPQYIPTYESLCEGGEKKAKITKTLEVDHITNFHVLYEDDVFAKLQLIHGGFFHESVGALLSSFDFTLCQLATDGTTLVVGPYTLIDIQNKKMTVNRITFPAASMTRIAKYGKRGYTLCNGEAQKFLRAVVEDPSLVEENFKYID